MKIEEVKSYLNKDLTGQSDDQFDESMKNDFIGEGFVDQLEWAMLMISGKFKQLRMAEHLPPISKNHFDKSYLIAGGVDEVARKDTQYYLPFRDMQASPDIFPNINMKYMTIHDTVSLTKVRELPAQDKRGLLTNSKYVFALSQAFYKKDTESFYGVTQGWGVNPGFFKLLSSDDTTINDIPNPVSLKPGYLPGKSNRDILHEMTENKDEDATFWHESVFIPISMAYQIALSMFYEWCVYIKEYDNIGLVLPIDPSILSEIYKTSMLKFEDKKRMLHFVRDHYRRKVADPKEDYSVYVRRYLRGEYKFDYRGFYTEIIPPKYELNRVTTRKKFTDPDKD